MSLAEHYARFRAKPSALPLAMAAMVLGLSIVFAQFASEMMEGELTRFDTMVGMVFRAAPDAGTPIGPVWLQEMVRDITALGSFAVLGIIFIGAISYLLLTRRRGMAGLLTFAVLGGVIVSSILKASYNRPRPDLQHSAQVFTASFPSGHAMLSTVTFLTLGVLLARLHEDRRLRTFFVSFAVFLTLLIGISRVYLGVHYPSDVAGGWIVGSAWALLTWTIALYLQARGKVEPPH